MVVAVAVDLDGEALGGPAAVDPPSAGGAVGLGQRELGGFEPRQEPSLERAERDVDVAAENAAQGRRARAQRSPLEHRVDLRGRRSVEDSRLVASARECIDGQHGREVDKRTRDGGRGDVVDLGDVARVKGSTAPSEDALDAPFGARRHLGRGWAALDEAAEVARGSPAQHRALAARLHRREVARLAARRAMSDTVDTPVLGQQRSRAHAPLDLPRRDAGRQEPSARHHTVPPAPDPSQNLLDRPALTSHSDG
jgi:hypothetical protein